MVSYPEMADIKWFYDRDCYTDDDVRLFVELGCITESEFTEITGKPYAIEETPAPTEDEPTNVDTPSEGPSGEADGSAGSNVEEA
ncbi:XkdX family protein [Bacillus spizizenii]|uniref:XkdX family protein n=1 Tax=Bacillus spizizenii TaxID=96241 RepID=UPI002FC70472